MKVISFNSYKGGACRTTTCYNTLPYLAKELQATSRQPVIVVDCDLDSMGLTNIFHADSGKEEQKEKLPYSAKHLFVKDNERINERMNNSYFKGVLEDEWYFGHFEKVGEDLGLEDNGSVLFLGVDKLERTISDDDYESKEKFAQYAPVSTLIKRLESLDESLQPKAIIFDCAAGVQMTTIAILKNIEFSVMCMRPTLQFRIGTLDYLYRMLPGQLNSSLEEDPKIIILPTSVAQSTSGTESDGAGSDLETLRADAIKDIKMNIVDFIIDENENTGLGYTLVPDMAEPDCFGLPEVERFKWQESLLFKRKQLTEQEKVLQDRYIKLAKILTRYDG